MNNVIDNVIIICINTDLCCKNIIFRVFVTWFPPESIQCNWYFSILFSFISRFVSSIGFCVSENHVMSTFVEVETSCIAITRWKRSNIVPLPTIWMRLRDLFKMAQFYFQNFNTLIKWHQLKKPTSLNVIHFWTLSPNEEKAKSAKSLKWFIISGESNPPKSSWSFKGKSQWNNVIIGSMPWLTWILDIDDVGAQFFLVTKVAKIRMWPPTYLVCNIKLESCPKKGINQIIIVI